MASYIVLARKWRPQTFADLVGQQHIAVTLRNAIAQNRVAHAFLFTGSRGVGKTSTARIFAKALNCAHFPSDEPCNECESCREITEGHSMDVIEIDGASNRGINEIREVLDAVRYAPSRDRYKIYIIDEVHMLTTEAFNALLKTLEEPPPHVVFIFATTDPNKIPITIVSRCQRYDFKRIGTDDLVAHLSHIAESENIRFEESALRLIARTARGGVRDALSAMDQIIAFAEQPISGERAAEILGVASRETLMKMGECIARKNVAGALECIEKVDHYGQNLSQFAFDLLEFWRDVTVLAAAHDAPVELNASEKAMIEPWLPLMSFDRLQRTFQIWYQTSEMLPKSLSPRLVMEMAAIRMCQIESVGPLDGILRRLDALARAIGNSQNLTPDALQHIQAFLGPMGLQEDSEKKKSEFIDILPPKAPLIAPESQGTASQHSPRDPEIPKAKAPDVPAHTSVHADSPKPPTEPAHAEREVPPVCAEQTENKPESGSSRPAESIPARTDDAGEVKNNAQDEVPDYLNDTFWFDESAPNISQEMIELIPNDWDYEDEEEDENDSSDDESPINVSFNKKILAVSGDRPKTAQPAKASDAPGDKLYRWKQMIDLIGRPLSMILSRARVDCFTRESVEITLPSAYAGILTSSHIREIEHCICTNVYAKCRFSVHFGDFGTEAETVAAQKAREQLDAQQKEFDRVRNHPIMKTITDIFHIEPEAIRFTINPDRTLT